MPSRRHVLATAGLAVASTGCTNVLGSEGDEDEESTEEAPEPGEVRLGELYVQNNHDDAHQVQVAVGVDDDLLHLGSYELKTGGDTRSAHIEGPWEESFAAYRVYARLDDGPVRTADVTDGVSDGVDCVRVLVRIDDTGRLAIWNGAGCDADDGF